MSIQDNLPQGYSVDDVQNALPESNSIGDLPEYDFGTELPPNRKFTKLYQKRVANSQDLTVIVSDHQNRRGTGKTVFSLKLASLLDRTEEGITKEKVSINPEELAEAYTEQPKGSALVLDEAEAGLSKYRAGSAVNMAMRELVSMGRIQEKYVIFNLPSSSALDTDLKALCSFWFSVKQKGRALGHFLHWNQYRGEPRTPQTGHWNWTDIPEGTHLREVYDYLTDKKMKHLRGESDASSQKVSQSELQDRIEQAKSETETKVRNELLTQIYRNSDFTQQELADSIELTRSGLADIVRE